MQLNNDGIGLIIKALLGCCLKLARVRHKAGQLACGCLWLVWAQYVSAATIVVDGIPDEAAWADATSLGPFTSVHPFSDAIVPDDRRVEAKLLSTEEGIALTVKAWHPASVPQTRARIQRDGTAAVDRFNVMIDFNADGRAGYNFTITTSGDIADETITNQNVFNYDWDGTWKHAASDFDGGYSVEYLIPWSTAMMAESSSEVRTIGVYVDRVLAATGERQGFPRASFTRPRFLSDFEKIQIPQYRKSLLAVTPYGVAVADLSQRNEEAKTGADVVWKPNGDHQFALAIHPDFGHVESDQLVVNFSTTETVFTDKRPFFTENQSYFDLQHPVGQLFYTRRVGGPADAGTGASDIALAAKGVGRFGGLGYGAFVAKEEGQAGRDYMLARATVGDERLLGGATVSHVDRPALGRQSTVAAVDGNWKPNEHWVVRPLIAASQIQIDRSRVSGAAAGVVADWDMPGPWRQMYMGTFASDSFDLNDLGYQARNDFAQLEWENAYRVDELPSDSRFATHEYRLELIHRENTQGLRLLGQASIYRSSTRRDGGTQDAMLRWKAPQYDDRLTRGHGPVRIGGGPQLYLDWEQPRQGDARWGWYAQLEVFPNPLGGHSIYGGIRPHFHAGPNFDIDAGIFLWRQTDWLLWQHDAELGSFFAQRAEIYSDLNWFLGDKHELRLKLQAIGIDAKALKARRVLPGGNVVDSEAPLRDFQLRNLGFQIRYRYALNPKSDIFAVYGRGGYRIDDEERELGETLDDVFSLKDDHQILVKFAYRFELGS